LHRGNNDFRNGHKPGTDKANYEKGDLVTYSHSILANWRNNFYELLNAHGDKDIRTREICTTEPLVPDPNYFGFQIPFHKLKKAQISRY